MRNIHWSKVFEQMDEKDRFNRHIPFSFRYAKLNGELKTYTDCRLSSIHYRGATVNITVGRDGHPKKFRKILITEFNNQRVYI